MKTKFNCVLGQVGITLSQYQLIRFLYNKPGYSASPAEIAAGLECNRPTVTGIVDRLYRQAFVVREVNHEDRRYQNVILTKKTEDLMKQINKQIEVLAYEAFNGLNEDELATLEHYLDVTFDGLTNLRQQGSIKNND